jgi:hypothetical protein
MPTFRTPRRWLARGLVLATALAGCTIAPVAAPVAGGKASSTVGAGSAAGTGKATTGARTRPAAKLASPEERLRAAMRKQFETLGLELFACLDKDRDGKLVASEIPTKDPSKPDDNPAGSEFKDLDANRDGVVDQGEGGGYADMMMRKTPTAATQKHVDDFLKAAGPMLKDMDTSKDGKVSKAEYLAGFLTAYNRQAAANGSTKLDEGPPTEESEKGRDELFDRHAGGDGLLDAGGVACVLHDFSFTFVRLFMVGFCQMGAAPAASPTPKPAHVVTEEDAGATLALANPKNLVVSADGTLTVLDNGAVVQFLQNGKKRTLLPKGAFYEGQFSRLEPENLKRGDGSGWAFVVGDKVYQLSSDGSTKVVAETKVFGSDIVDYAFGPDGSCYLAREKEFEGVRFISDNPVTVEHHAADGRVTRLPDSEAWYLRGGVELRMDATGKQLLIHGAAFDKASETSTYVQGTWRWSAGANAVPVNDVDWPDAVDAQGRLYWGYRWPGAANIRRLDRRKLGPDVDRLEEEAFVEVVVGPGGKAFTGTGVDDGVNEPIQPGFDAAGNLYFIDSGHKQIKKVPADQL